jgi:hypothetical protein
MSNIPMGLAEYLKLSAEWQNMLHNKDAERMYRRWASEVESAQAALSGAVPEQQNSIHQVSDSVVCMAPWQPIETAPKDGTHVLISNDAPGSVHPREGYYVAVEHRYENEPQHDGWWRLAGSSEAAVHGRTPTHWMPLPPAPGSQADTEGRPTNEKESAPAGEPCANCHPNVAPEYRCGKCPDGVKGGDDAQR